MAKQLKKIESPKDAKQSIKLLVNPDVQKGIYSNVALIHHTKNEYIMDFLLQIGGEAQLVSRIILSPDHMKALRKAIDQNIEKYENEFNK